MRVIQTNSPQLRNKKPINMKYHDISTGKKNPKSKALAGVKLHVNAPKNKDYLNGNPAKLRAQYGHVTDTSHPYLNTGNRVMDAIRRKRATPEHKASIVAMKKSIASMKAPEKGSYEDRLSSFKLTNKEANDYQRRFGRAYND